MPAPVVTRELSITYAGFTVGGTTAYHLHGDPPYRQTDGYERYSIDFHVLVQEATEAAFAAACRAVEAAYRTPRGALVVALGSAALKTLSHAGSTGYNAD